MAISFRSVAANQSLSAVGITVAAPAGLAAGDLLVALCSGLNAPSTPFSPPSGWTVLWATEQGTQNIGSWAGFAKVATAADVSSGSFTFTAPSTVSQFNVVVGAWQGNAVTDIVGALVSNATGVAGQIVTNYASELVLYCCHENNSGGATLVPPTGTTSRVNNDLASNALALAEAAQASAGTTPSGITWAGGSFPGFDMRTISLTGITLPLAPTLNSPVNGSYDDLAAGFAFGWTYNPGVGGTGQTAYAMRRKIGAGAYEYWNAGTGAWQSTIVWNSSTALGVTFAAGKWTNGNTYNFSVATQDNAGQGPFAGDSTVVAANTPSTILTAPVSPVIAAQVNASWANSLAAGLSQTAYRLVVETGGYGTTPGSGTQVYDSGVVSSAVTTAPISNLTNLLTHRVFLQVTQTGGQTTAWATLDFTAKFDAPATPSIIAVWDSTNARAALAVQGDDNLLTANMSSLETDTTGWSARSNCTIARSTAQFIDGSASLLFTSSAAGAMSVVTAATTAVVSGKTYTAVASVRAATVARSVRVAIDWYTAGITYISTSIGTANGDNTAGFAQVTVTGAAPANAGLAAVYVEVLGTAAAGEGHYTDQIGLFPASAVTSVSNLIPNPSFESGTTGWSANNGTIAVSSAHAFVGAKSLKCTAGAANPVEPWIGPVTVAPSTTYTFSVYVWSETATRAFQIHVDFVNASGVTNSGDSASANVGAGWTRITLTATSAATATGVFVNVASTSATSGDVFYIDAMQMESGNVANPYVDGSQGPGYSWDASQNLLSAAASSFEDGTTGGWAAVGTGTTIANSATRAQDGTKSLLVTLGAGAAGGFGASVNLTLAPNTTYTASVYCYLPAASVASTQIKLSGTGVATVTETAATTTASFVRHVLTFTTNGTGGTVTLSVLNGATSTAGQTFFVDAAQVEQRAYATPYGQAGTANNATSTFQQPWTIGGFAASGSYTVEASTDGVTWKAIRGGTGLTVDSAADQRFTVYDYEQTPGVTVTYRARVSDGSGAQLVTSLNSPTVQLTSSYTSWWLKDPADATANIPVNVTKWAPKVSERAGTFSPLGRGKPVVVSDAVGGLDGTVSISTFQQSEWPPVLKLLQRARSLLLQAPWGEQWYVRVSADRTVNLPGAAAWQREVALPYAEVDAP